MILSFTEKQLTAAYSNIWSIDVSHAQEDEPVQEEEVQQGLPRQDQHHGCRAGVQSRLQGTVANTHAGGSSCFCEIVSNLARCCVCSTGSTGIVRFPEKSLNLARYCLCNTSRIVPCRTGTVHFLKILVDPHPVEFETSF
jgi:hypothetical protein